ncbi:Uma2 family endonuclease [Biomphalaria pfeifferi]|uniref:Uma2 family endonuclease n=1 Tax=Biomphalaria pfeifferi TaxID=112525 RepID=A0AAD8AMI8_BIOPF|nr:Uma2 family endonuclease [Biomphalaria pfeifferi]
MLAEVEEITDLSQTEENEMPSFNHSYICNRVLRQLFENEAIEALPELTLDIDKGITPDISVFEKNTIKPNFLRDFVRFPEMPIIAIEVISASQNIQDLLEKAELMVNNGIKAVWTIEPFSGSIFVTTKAGEEIFHNQEVESENIKVDFKQIFG